MLSIYPYWIYTQIFNKKRKLYQPNFNNHSSITCSQNFLSHANFCFWWTCDTQIVKRENWFLTASALTLLQSWSLFFCGKPENFLTFVVEEIKIMRCKELRSIYVGDNLGKSLNISEYHVINADTTSIISLLLHAHNSGLINAACDTVQECTTRTFANFFAYLRW